MAESYIQTIKTVFSNRNILGIALTSSLWSVANSGWRPFRSLYLMEELGATVYILGMLSMLTSSEQLLFQLPGGILADKFGRRKIIVYGTSLRIISPLIYLFATHWTHVIPALLLEGAASIYMPAFRAIIADSLPENERGAGYGAYRMITSMPRIFSPMIGGIIMDRMGYREGAKIFLIAACIAGIIITYVRSRIITETLVQESRPRRQSGRGLLAQLKPDFNFPRTIKVMIIVSIVGSFGTRMVMGFIPVYAIDIIGLTNTQLGFVQTTMAVIATALAFPGGILSDHFGRKPMILISRIVSPFTLLGITLSSTFQQYYLVRCTSSIGGALGGGGMGFAGGPAWNALIADIVPMKNRATVMGTLSTLTGFVGAPSSVIGGYLWTTFNPQLPFQISMVLCTIAAIIFALGVKEPKRRITRKVDS